MIDSLGFRISYDSSVYEFFKKGLLARNRKSIRSASKMSGKILKRLINKENINEEISTSMFLKGNYNIDFYLKTGRFSKKALKVYSNEEGRIFIKLEKIPENYKDDINPFLKFLFLSEFKGDADNFEFATSFKQIKAELYIAMVANSINQYKGRGLSSHVVNNIVDALIFESYSRDTINSSKEKFSFKKFISKIFYLLNPNYTAYKQIYSNNLLVYLEKVDTISDWFVLYLSFFYFTRMIQGGKKIDIEEELLPIFDLKNKPHAKQDAIKIIEKVKDYIEYNFVNTFMSSITKDIQNTCNRYEGTAYFYYEKILHSFGKKAYEDIFQTLKRMVKENLIFEKREYYLFYRIFAFSFFEANYPSGQNIQLTDVERTATKNRFMYISSFINRLSVNQEELPVSKEQFFSSLSRRLKNVFVFSLIVYVFVFFVNLFDNTILYSFFEGLGNSIINTIFSIDKTVTGSNGTLNTYKILDNFFNNIISSSNGVYGIIYYVLVIGIVGFFMYITVLFYKIVINGFFNWVTALKEKSRTFYIVSNILLFLLVFNFIIELMAFIPGNIGGEKVLLVQGEKNKETIKEENFTKRFLYSQGFYSRYSMDSISASDLSAAVMEMQEKNKRNNNSQNKENVEQKKEFEKYNNILFNVDPYYFDQIQDYIKKRIEVWKSKGTKNLNIVLLNRLPKGKSSAFIGLPILENLVVKNSRDPETGRPYAIVVATKDLKFSKNQNVTFNNQMYTRIPQESDIQKLVKKWRSKKNKMNNLESIPWCKINSKSNRRVSLVLISEN